MACGHHLKAIWIIIKFDFHPSRIAMEESLQKLSPNHIAYLVLTRNHDGDNVQIVCTVQIDGFVQERHNSCVLAMELILSYTNPSKWCIHKSIYTFTAVTHYCDIIMSVMASQITSLTIVYSTVYSGAGSKKTLCGEFTGDQWISHTKGLWHGKCFHLMTSSWQSLYS